MSRSKPDPKPKRQRRVVDPERAREKAEIRAMYRRLHPTKADRKKLDKALAKLLPPPRGGFFTCGNCGDRPRDPMGFGLTPQQIYDEEWH